MPTVIGCIKDAIIQLSGRVEAVAKADYAELERVKAMVGKFARLSNKTVFLLDHNTGNLVLLGYRRKVFLSHIDEAVESIATHVSLHEDFRQHLGTFISSLQQSRSEWLPSWRGENARFVFFAVADFNSEEHYPMVTSIYPVLKARDGRVWVTMAVIDRSVNQDSALCCLYDSDAGLLWKLGKRGNLERRHVFLDVVEEKICSLLYAGYSPKEITKMLGLDRFKVNNVLKSLRLRFGQSKTRSVLIVLRILKLL